MWIAIYHDRSIFTSDLRSTGKLFPLDISIFPGDFIVFIPYMNNINDKSGIIYTYHD